MHRCSPRRRHLALSCRSRAIDAPGFGRFYFYGVAFVPRPTTNIRCTTGS